MNPDRLFRAFADETRLRILSALGKGELCVCDLRALIGAPQPRISRHLASLKRAGLVSDRKDGKWRHYSLSRPKSRFQRQLLACVGSCLGETPVLRKDAERLRAMRGVRCR